MMKIKDYFIIAGLVFFLALSVALIVKINATRRQNEINIGKLFYLKKSIGDNLLSAHIKLKIKDSALFEQYRIIYRYQDGGCTDCINKGLLDLEYSLSPTSLKRMLILSNSPYSPFKRYKNSIEYDNIPILDSSKQPYVCFVDKKGSVLFYLELQSNDVKINRELLTLIDSRLSY